MRTTLRAVLGLSILWTSLFSRKVSGQGRFQGSTPTGQASSTPLQVSLQDAIDRGLKNNLGLLTRENSSQTARAERIRALSDLMPDVTARATETSQQLALAAFGFKFPGVPSVVGPFDYLDARIGVTQTVLDWNL